MGVVVMTTPPDAVKPVALMRWLVRLVTPPGGLVLDPFAGSGTTGIACALEGFRFLGVEQDPGYAAIARRRIRWAALHPAEFDPDEDDPPGTADRSPPGTEGRSAVQQSMFG